MEIMILNYGYRAIEFDIGLIFIELKGTAGRYLLFWLYCFILFMFYLFRIFFFTIQFECLITKTVIALALLH